MVENMEVTTIGSALKKYAEQMGMSSYRAAKEFGTGFWSWTHDVNVPKMNKTIERIHSVTGWPVSYINKCIAKSNMDISMKSKKCNPAYDNNIKVNSVAPIVEVAEPDLTDTRVILDRYVVLANRKASLLGEYSKIQLELNDIESSLMEIINKIGRIA